MKSPSPEARSIDEFEILPRVILHAAAAVCILDSFLGLHSALAGDETRLRILSASIHPSGKSCSPLCNAGSAGPRTRLRCCKTPVSNQQVAPSIMKALAINPHELNDVPKEQVHLLPFLFSDGNRDDR
jgi:hypothetical protein